MESRQESQAKVGDHRLPTNHGSPLASSFKGPDGLLTFRWCTTPRSTPPARKKPFPGGNPRSTEMLRCAIIASKKE